VIYDFGFTIYAMNDFNWTDFLLGYFCAQMAVLIGGALWNWFVKKPNQNRDE
jgi:hypothetical protein